MTAKVSIDDKLLKQLQSAGELRVEDLHGVPIVLMTVDAREQLGHVVYDDDALSADDMVTVLADQVNDPEGMGAPGMDEYDEKYGHLFNDDGNAQ